MLRIVIYAEYHCEECNDVVHNHFDCPACNTVNSGTKSFYDLAEDAGDCTIECEKCGTRFHTAGKYPYDWDVEQWEKVPSDRDHDRDLTTRV